MDLFGYALDRVQHILRPDVTIIRVPYDVVVEKDVPVPMREPELLYVDIFKPKNATDPLPVIMCAHPYQKDNLLKQGTFVDTLPMTYRMIRIPKPLTLSEGCGWEAPDPAFWVPKGYILINMDLRGFGKSTAAGKGLIMSDDEAQDYYDAIEWVAAQPWCSGKVGLCGVSYLAISQYKVAALNPPHLAAICPWEGLSDMYKDLVRPGGVQDVGFSKIWFSGIQAGVKEDLQGSVDKFETRSESYLAKTPNLANITCPALVCMSYSDHGLHTNGSFRVFRTISSTEKWLYTHRDGKWNAFYSEEGLSLQLKFFDCFLKGRIDNGMLEVPRVRVEVRDTREHIHSVLMFPDPIYPVPSTRWTTFRLSKDVLTLKPIDDIPLQTVPLHTCKDFISFKHTFDDDTIINGPMKATLLISSDTITDMHIFVWVRKFDVQGNEVNFEGMLGWGYDVVAKGWQRLAMRKPFDSYSEPWDCDKPFDEIVPLEKGRIEPVTVQLLPSSTMFEKGSSMVLEVSGMWRFPVGPLSQMCNYKPTAQEGVVDIHCGGAGGSSLMVGVLST